MDRATRTLALASVLYLASAIAGTALSIAENLPARAGGILSGTNVLLDFLTLNGTALSAPCFMLIAQVVFTALLWRPGQARRVGSGGLTVLGVLYTLGQLAEPILYRSFSPLGFDAVVAAVIVCNLVFGIGMVVAGVAAWRGTPAAITADAMGR